jgi:hypothetical protein
VEMDVYRAILYVWRINKSFPTQRIYTELKRDSEVVCHTEEKDCTGVGQSDFDQYCRTVLDLYSAECGVNFVKFSVIVEKGEF